MYKRQTSLADAEHFRKCAEIIKAEEERKFAVVSAPGKRSATDEKVTDLLIACADGKPEEREDILAKVQSRYKVLARSLNVSVDIDGEFSKIRAALGKEEYRDYIISRGEYLNAKIIDVYKRQVYDLLN